jgi:lipoprotein-anchoring transpeptidase ErfK/SrfK
MKAKAAGNGGETRSGFGTKSAARARPVEGARAPYLFKSGKDTLFRIHGTNEPGTIGRAVSSGCIRMLNADVIDLYQRVAKGTAVVAL